MGEGNEAAAAAEGKDEPPAPASREQLRSRRKRVVRARTISVKRMTKRQLEIDRLLFPADELDDVERPKTRADCQGGQRPCPFVSCAHHLYLDISARTGAIKLNFPDLAPEELSESCALDVADRGGVTLEETGAIMNLTRERIRQIEVTGLAKVRAVIEMGEFRGLADYADPSPHDARKRRLPVLHEQDEAEDEDDAGRDTDFDAERFASEALDSE